MNAKDLKTNTKEEQNDHQHEKDLKSQIQKNCHETFKSTHLQENWIFFHYI